MKAAVVLKAQGGAARTVDGDRIPLDAPSVVQLAIGPEQVARFERQGNDLVLILEDGRILTIENFFVTTAEGRNDLVFEDGNGVVWWAQYGDNWTGFEIAEINEDAAVGPVAAFSPALLAGLGLLAGGGVALAAGGGSTSSTPKDERLVAAPENETTPEDTPLRGNVLANDKGGNGNPLTVTSFEVGGVVYTPGDTATIPGVGTITVGEDGNYVFTPEPNWNGTVPPITYTISDGKGGTDTTDLNITVTPVDDLKATDDSAVTQEDTLVDGTVATNDSTTSGGTLIFTKETDPGHGTVVMKPDGTYTYTPDANYNGPDSFTYTVTDPDSGESKTQTVNITVNPVNDAPEPVGTIVDQADADADPITALDISSFFKDVDGDTLTYSASGLPAGLAIDPVTGIISGTIDNSASQDGIGGAHNITITASDGKGGSVTQSFTWTVTNPTPLANNDAANTPEDTAVSGNVLGGIGAGSGDVADSDPDGDSLSVTGFTIAGDPASHGVGAPVTIAGVGTLILGSDGNYTFTPAANWNGTVPTISYTISDGEGGTDTADLNITVTPVNDAPVAVVDSGAVTEAGVLEGGNTPTAGEDTAVGNVLDNDTDVDEGEKATLTVDAVSFGGAAGTLGEALAGTYGSLVLNANGTYTYRLDNGHSKVQALKPGETATEIFTYTVADVNGAKSTSTLTITVTGTNDQPVITSDAVADATGEVTEQGTANPTEKTTATGTLTASDVDTDATQTWSLGTTNGTYGSIAIDPKTGQWIYTLDNSRPETQKLNDGDTRTETFTARVTDEFGAYSEQDITVTVKGSNDAPTGRDETVTLTEDESASGTLQHYVTDVDDTLVVTGFTIDADGDGTAENYTPGTTVTLKDMPGNPIGTLIVEENGDYTFTPAPNYAGEVPTLTYTMAEPGSGSETGSVTQTLDFTITKIADAPDMEASKTVNTKEDQAVALGLKTPVITDTGTGDGNNDNPERIGEITLTIGGSGAEGVTLSTDGMTLTPVGGKITIVLTDMPHATDVPAADTANGIYHLTTDQYEALTANPLAESGKDFTVTVSATSYEVDASGAKIAGIDGATSTQVIDVDVQAVTDGATLAIDGEASITAIITEDETIDLTGHLTVTLNNTDGNTSYDTDDSETYWYTIEGLPVGTVVTINGVATTISATTSTASSAVSTSETPPTISIKPPLNYSGDLNGITITLNTKDTDSDSNGTISTITSTVTLNLHVTPVAGDVSVSDVTTPEDTAVAFLAGVTVTDKDSGTEVINSVEFEIPAGWAVTPPATTTGWSYAFDGTTATITFDDTLTETQRETILDGFMIKPPAHDSADKTIKLSITTTDSNTVNGSNVSDTKTVNLDVKVTVTPVAEKVDDDSDGDGNFDVTMIGNHAYTMAGKEDSWFALGVNYTDATNAGGGYDLKTGWSNADSDEFIYAVLTPTLESDTEGDTVIGTQFRYYSDDDATWVTQTYAGEPIWVPQQYLNTLQVKLPADVSGTLTIGVQAGTVDYDDDAEVPTLPLNPPHVSGEGVNVAISGKATLSMIEFKPVADEVTMALNGRAAGEEDTAIPLAIRTTSSDVSETFDVTISGIPVGAKITYDGVELTVEDGSVTIPNFSNSVPLTITPPLNSNVDFKLTVSAVSKDGGDISDPVSRTIDVSVTGVADTPVVTLPATPFSTSEAELDASGHKVALNKIVTEVTSPDGDGSETVSVRITGLAEGFSLTGATMVVSGTGGERVWTVAANKLADVEITVPKNYSGTVSFKVVGVTTENDGDSHTGSLTDERSDVSFTVTPSPEATITESATLVEDEITKLNLGIVHQNGDTDETLGAVYVPVGYDTASYTLYLNGTELSDAKLEIVKIDGKDYYEILADEVKDLGAMGAPDKDGDLGTLDFLYEVIDPSSDGTLTPASEVKSGTLTLDATPVTDAVDASITGITMGTATGSTADNISGDDATPDTAIVTKGGSVTVNLHVASEDTDGSEHLIRILIEGVPDGVTVSGASQIGAGSWLLVYDGDDAESIGAVGIDVPVEFIVGNGAAGGTAGITMTVQAKDRGNSPTSEAGIETDSVQWTLEVDLADGGGGLTPPVIDAWSYNGATGTEDTAFKLGDVMNATVSAGDNGQAYSYTVTITDLPDGSIVEGMIFTTIDGVPTWTATVTVPAGGDSQTALETLLAGISITPPENSNNNNNNNNANFSFDAKLTASVVGGSSEVANTVADMPVVPVTDDPVITVVADNVGEGESSVTATITASNPVDGEHGEIVGGKLYVQVTTSGNDGGTVTDSNGDPVPLTEVSDVDGVPFGNYYVIDVGPTGGSAKLTYTAADGTVLAPGDVTFTAHAQTKETGAKNVATGSASGTAAVEIVNNGVTVESQPVTGKEATAADKANAIELERLSVTLNDADGSEAINSILLSGVPVGFLLYTGNSAGEATLATQASNAGGDGTTNTWVVSVDGKLPAYVAILPAPHWSGTLSDLKLIVESGEASLPEARVDTIALDPVTVVAIANGLTIDPTLSFGTEGDIIAMNLNVAMVDPRPAGAAVEDESTETTTLQVTGLGEHAAFYIGTDLVTSLVDYSVTYDAGNDTYTITGLSQDDFDGLGFKQAKSALTDQDEAAAGTQVTVTAWTVESANGDKSDPETKTLTVSMTPVLETIHNDQFIWSGGKIDGKAGNDTVALRYGESLTGEELAAQLRNIETIDLGIGGENTISDLTPEQAKAMLESGKTTLTITGSAEDKLTLGDGWSLNGDGTYTGTMDGSSSVTLTIDGDVMVSLPESPAAAPAMMMAFGAFDETEGFGLASLDAGIEPRVEEPQAGGSITIDDVLSTGLDIEDLTAGLPEEAGSGFAPSHDISPDAGFIDIGRPALEDELSARLLYEV